MMEMKTRSFADALPLAAAVLLAAASCGPPKAQDADEILQHITDYAGKVVVMRAKFRSGARCRQEYAEEVKQRAKEAGKDPKWQAYCKDCQYCRGPIVLDTGLDTEKENLDDWPMILGGTWKGQDIRCKGPLNQIDCYPFTLGKQYIVQGQIEHQRPPKLLIERFWEVE
jgi:hypothetical protein